MYQGGAEALSRLGKLGGAAEFVPASADLGVLQQASQGCRGCELYIDATQTVFGQGSTGADLLLVGEQPGDSEDRTGEPFVGPAGRMLNRALEMAGIERDRAYVTNAVKHFRFKSTESNTRRIHAKPGAAHIAACAPWLAAEIAAVTPRIIVALGATAGQALAGKAFRVTEQRGRLLDWPPPDGPYAGRFLTVEHLLATIHPSAILRGDPADREAALQGMADDLAVAAAAMSTVDVHRNGSANQQR